MALSILTVDIWCTNKKCSFSLKESIFDVTWPGPARPGRTGTLLRSSLKTMRYMEKNYLIRNVYSRLNSYVSKFQVCIYNTSGDTAVFVKVFFFIFSFFRQIFRQYNSRTIRHRDFQFKTLNRSCNRLPHVNIWF